MNVQPTTEAELIPCLFFYGRADEALEFYKSALGGSYEVFMRTEAGDPRFDAAWAGKVTWARFSALGISFAACDGMGPRSIGEDEGNVSLALTIHHEERARAVFDALSLDARHIGAPFGDAPWGGKFGMLRDRFHTEWLIAAPE